MNTTTASWKRIPFLRWSFWRMMLGIKHLTTKWQVGDGREARLERYVLERARPGDAADAVRVIDQFGWNESFLMNVGDEKGLILDRALDRAKPRLILELGTYCGYSSLRMAVAAPQARVVSIEFNPDNAAIARRIHRHAGVADRITIVDGTLGDGGKTIEALRKTHGLGPGSVDLVFVDHAKEVYLADLERIRECGWLRKGAIVVADNILFPGAPDYRAHMKEQEGTRWRSIEHETHLEYQAVMKDIVLESEYLGS